MDPTNATEGTDLNAQPGTSAGKALRARNPSNERVLLIEAPSTGYRDLVLSFATMRTNSGAQEQTVAWSTDPDHATWTELASTYAVGTDWSVRSFDMSGLTATYDAPHLAFRITFTGSNATGSSGNDRFDNITLTGHPVQSHSTAFCAGGSFTQDGITYSAAGTYLHPVQGPMDCGFVEVLHLAEVDPDTTVTQSVSGSFTVHEAGAQYQWTTCDGTPIDGATTQDYTPQQNGGYAVEVRVGDCTVTSGCHTILNVSVPEPNAEPLRLFPNPSLGHVTVAGGDGPMEWRLLDAVGRIVARGRTPRTPWTLDLSGMAPGTYTLQSVGDRPLTAIIIKQ